MDFSAIQIMIVLVIALLVFGPKRLPELGRQVGRAVRDLKSQMNDVTGGMRDAVTKDPEPSPATTRAESPAVPAPVDAATGHVVDPDEDLLDGVVVSGATGPTAKPPAES